MGCFNSKVSADKAASMTAKQTANHHQTQALLSSKSIDSAQSSHKNSLKLDTAGDTTASIKTLTFRHVMNDPLGREFFMKFLKKEHAEENLAFFEEVENLKRVEIARFVDSVNELVQAFLIPGVETEVNISDYMKTNLIKMASQDDIEQNQKEFIAALERAQKEIMMILAMGAFPRFIKSKFFQDYKRKARELREKEEMEMDESDGLRNAEIVTDSTT